MTARRGRRRQSRRRGRARGEARSAPSAPTGATSMWLRKRLFASASARLTR
jgi:hypothetical protein